MKSYWFSNTTFFVLSCAMFKKINFVVLGISMFLCHAIDAQTKILFPHLRQVFQRDQTNQATISILGNCPVTADKVQVKLEVVNDGQGESTKWLDIVPRTAGGFFNGKVKAKGGWYILKVRCYRGKELLDSAQLSRVGIGDNYLISGQSNAQGTIRRSSEQGATDERVIVANFYSKDLGSNQGGNFEYIGELGLDFPLDRFVHMDSLSTIGPIGLSPYYWAALGDSLVKNFHVPVCFINSGWTATSIRNWVESAEGLESTNPWASIFSYPKGFPYQNLKRSLEIFGKNIGFRAILWHQGETDSNFEMPKEVYQNYLKKLIQYSRRDAGFEIPWLVSEVSYFSALKNSGCTPGKINMEIIQAQRDILKLDDLPFVFSGPNTDDIEVPRKSDEISLCVHFTKDAYGELANRWFVKIKELLSAEVKPMMAYNIPDIVLYCKDTSLLNVREMPSIEGVQIDWLDSYGSVVGTAFNSQAFSPGKYRLSITDSLNQTLVTPYFNLEYIVKPNKPVVSVDGNLKICKGQQVILNVNSDNKYYSWSSGQNSSSISVSTSGAFKVLVQDDLGCKSDYSEPVTTSMFENPENPEITQLSPYFLTGGSKLFDVDFNWSLNNNPILNEKSLYLRVSQSGIYRVFASKKYAEGPTCISGMSEFSYVLPKDGGLSVYPNPAISSVFIQAKEDLAGAIFEVYSIDGREILTGKINDDGVFGFNVDSLPVGLYKLVVKLRTNEILQQSLVIGQ